MDTKIALSLQTLIHTYKSPNKKRYAYLYVSKMCRNPRKPKNKIFFGSPLTLLTMIPQTTIESVKQIRIVDYLYSLGVEPVKLSGVRLLYFSPKNDEQTPSFFVHPKENSFHDFTTGERGDIIRLVRYLTGCNFQQAVTTLQNIAPVPQTQPFSFIGLQKTTDPQKDKIRITKVKPLEHKALLKYVHDRCISTTIAKKYLKEIHYHRANKRTFAVAFENDKGGFEIRNPYFKSSTSPKWVTTFPVPDSKTVNLFEGFFDFLSSCEYFGLIQPRNTTIVLNSVTNLHHVLNELKSYKQVNVYFDNDNAGKKAVQKVAETGIKVFDGASKYYPNYKDFNDMVMGLKERQ